MGIQMRLRAVKRKYVRLLMLPNMMGFTNTVQPTPVAQPVMPKPFTCARILEGKISVGIKKATVSHVAA
jgi:hypothetical protein